MIPSKKQWDSWSLPSKYTAIGLLIGIVGLFAMAIPPIVSMLSSGEKSSTIEKAINPESVLHVIPGDFVFDLKEIKDNEYPNTYTVNLKVQSRESPVLLVRKALVKSFELNESYFVNEYSREFKIIDVKTKDVSLEKSAQTTDVELVFDTIFVFIDPYDLVWRSDGLSSHEMGHIDIELYYIFNGIEYAKAIRIPVRFI